MSGHDETEPLDPWQGCHPPIDNADSSTHAVAFERMVEANEEFTKREVLSHYFTARQDDLRALGHAFAYQQDLEEALREVLDALSGGACPSHDATEEGCAACEAIVVLAGGFEASLTRKR